MALGENIKLLNIPSIQKDDKIYGTIPQGNTSDYICSRNGSATYFDKDCVIRIAEPNQPRLDFDPATGEFKGVLVEEEATNFVIQNNPNNIPSVGYDFEEFQDEIYGTAYKVFEPLGYSGNHSFYNTNTNTVLFNNIRARYIIAKSGSGNRFLQVSPRPNGWLGVLFNLETQTYEGLKGDNLYEPFVIQLKNGWAIYGFIDYILNNTFPVNGGYSIAFNPNRTVNSSSTIYTNDGSFIYVLPYPMAYIGEQFIMPIITNGSQVTRPADIITIPNYSTLFGSRNSRLISVNNQNKIILNDEINQLPLGHNKLMFEKDDFLSIEEQESLSATTVSYGVREDIKDEFNEILSLNPSLVLIPGKSSVGELQTLLPNDGTGDFSVSRNGTATYLGKDGLLKTAQANEPRLEFNPDGSFKGVLVEPSATNLVLRSEEFQGTSFGGNWSLAALTASELNITTSPNGTLSADKIIPTTIDGSHFIFQSIPNNKTSVHTASCFFKASDYTRCGIRFNDNNTNQGQIFDLISGQVVASVGTKTTAEISNYGNGWYRCECTITSPTNLLNIQFAIVDNNSTVFEFIGDNTKGLYIWGAQLEFGSVATSYIPTVASTVTRPADIIQKTNAQDLIGQSEGSVYVEFELANNNIQQRISINKNGTSQNNIRLIVSNKINFSVFVDNIQTSIVSINNIENGTIVKLCATYKQGEMSLILSNGEIIKNTNFNKSFDSNNQVNTINFHAFVATLFWNSPLKNFSLFKTALTDSQAIALTQL